MSERNLLPIGVFARACKLTVKALRHYDQLGLLRPAQVDPASGYRYYHPGQAREAITIALLRSIDLPLAAIHTVLAGDEPAARAALDEQRARIDRDRLRAEQALKVLDHYLHAGATLTDEVGLRFEPRTRLASRRLSIPSHDDVPATHAAFTELVTTLDAAGCRWSEPALTLLHGTADDTMTVDVAVGFTGDPSTLPDPIRPRDLPAGPVVETVHKGPYETVGIAHAAIHAWAQEHGHHASGPLREIYLNDPAHTPAEALLTRVLMPVHPDERC
jgi:DNA-binding transcriptional MerR regulator/effector-binding domain-containing protein